MTATNTKEEGVILSVMGTDNPMTAIRIQEGIKNTFGKKMPPSKLTKALRSLCAKNITEKRGKDYIVPPKG